jgi:hypothetical protein
VTNFGKQRIDYQIIIEQMLKEIEPEQNKQDESKEAL